ncbi:uncharacterized protein OCT59_015174 [Rhizophagus irregularis]|uniref:Uncharacterized protein n=1 Tax=Rhizophagus irregularis (strain DAOM 197198w) TaxID=1432141 RepID=A0A015LR99_RHIIW|nr:hypothetical protein RirG_208950 [Rhizophagus irregularis DAOM 197198w]UZO22825.1 hypothetical protein OCT59_015174 [Rhizophagus irregularis]GBC19015.1 hypothetical protein GLOIN_2v1778880 [Rhizophagus irregularis DAOM 181602=DAOM 197198]
MSLEQLSRYAPEILELLPEDREKRRQARDHLQKGYNFSKEQAFALVPSQRTGRTKNQVVSKEGVSEAEVNICCTKSACQVSDIIPEGEIIKETAQRIMRDSLGEKEVKLIAKALAETSPNPVACTSSLSRLRKELRKLNAPKAIIEATKIPGITTLSNKIQKEKSLLCEDEGIHYPDYFSLESVKERLDSYDVSNTPDKQALADVMIMLCIRPAEIKDLRISNGGVTGYVKNRDQQDIPRVFRSLEKNEERAKQLLTWIQEAISSGRLGDPGTPGTGILSRFLKKAEFLPETGKPLLPSSLRNLGAVFAVVASGVRNLSKANTIASQALRHSPKNNTAPSQRYTIVNYRPRGMPYDQANLFMFFDEN